MQGSSGSHEDEIMQAGLDETLAQEEAAEQDVLAQLRQRAASLERDLLQRSLDGLTPHSKVTWCCNRRLYSCQFRGSSQHASSEAHSNSKCVQLDS